MGIEWQEDIKSDELISMLYTYLFNTYGMGKIEVDETLNLHKEYETFVVIDGKGYARFNIKGTIAYIMDCVVIDGGLKTLRKLCWIGKDKFPYLKTIKFERQLKKRKNMRYFKLNDFIKKEVL